MSALFLSINFQGNDKLTNTIEKMSSAAKKLEGNIGDAQKAAAKLDTLNLKIKGFEENRAEVARTAAALAGYKTTIKNIKAEMDAGSTDSSLAKRLKNAEKEAAKLQNTMDKERGKARRLGEDLEKAGYGGMKFADAQKRIAQQMTQSNAAIERQKANLARLQKAESQYNRAKELSGKFSSMSAAALRGATVAGSMLTIPTQLAIDGEKAMSDVAKVVDGLKIDGKITAEYKQFENQLIAMSNRLGMKFGDIAAIVAGGAQGGIAKSELMRYAESAVKIGIAWEMSADKVGQSIAELRSTFQMSQAQVEHLADQINYLGNNSTNAAPFILDVVQYVGAIAESAKLSSGALAAMGASVAGIDASTTATGIKNILKSMTAGEAATKQQRKAWQKLGLDASQVSQDMMKDAEGTYLRVLELIGKLPEHERGAMTSVLFGAEAKPVVSQHLTNLEKFRQYLHDVNELKKVQGSVQEEYDSAKAR